MTDDDPNDDTPRTYDNGGHQQSGPYRGLDPAQADLYRRMERLEARDEARERVQAETASSLRIWKWALGVAAPVVLAAAFGIAGYAVGQIASSAEHVGETKAEIRALSKLIDILQSEVFELRRHAGLDPDPRGTVALGGP